MPSQITIREAATGDGWDISELYYSAYHLKNSSEVARTSVTDAARENLVGLWRSDGPGGIWVAEHDEIGLCGSVALFPVSAKGNNVWIAGAFGLRHLMVHPDLRGTGLSQELLNFAEERARHHEATGICVHIPDNAPGVEKVFARRGYSRDPSGDIDRGSQGYFQAYFLNLA